MTLSLWRLLWREAAHRRLNFVLTVFSVMAACITLLSVMTLLQRQEKEAREVLERRAADLASQLERYDDSLRRSMQHLGFSVLLLPADQSLSDFYADDYATATMSEEVLAQLQDAGLMTIEHLVPRLRQKLLWPERQWTVQVVGTGADIVTPSTDAAELGVDPPPPGFLDVGAELHRSLELQPGERLELHGIPLVIRRCLPEAGTVDDITLWLDLEEAQRVLRTPGRINEVLALQCRAAWQDLPRIRSELGRLFPDLQVIEKRSETLAKAAAREMMQRESEQLLAREAHHRQMVLGQERRLGAVVTGVALLLASLWVSLLSLLNARSRRVEVGILRACGVGRSDILALFTGRTFLACVCGGAIGFAVTGVFWGFPGPAWLLCWLGASLGTAGLIALLGGVWPVWRTIAVDPALVLQGHG